MSEPKGRLLVVDDNENNRDFLSRRLQKEGYEVETADEGVRALELIGTRPFDLVLLDWMMPGLTGLELLKIVRQDRSAAELPIIMATAKDKSDDMVEALQLGANDYVTKPIDVPVVLARIEAQLRIRNAARKSAGAARGGAVVGKGTVLADKYKLEEKIGSGAFGSVYRGRHLSLDRPVAVKVLEGPMTQSAGALARFQREGMSACRIRHPNAVAVLDFGVAEGAAYLVMELLEGVSLHEELKQRGALPASRAAQILVPVCNVLAEAHRTGIVHRDIKPANIFLHRDRSGEVVKVLDFGIARLMVDDSGQQLTVEGSVVGTPAYMAPERLSNAAYDGRSDVYSVAIVLYQMLAGEVPFQGEDLMAVAMLQMTQAPPPLGERVAGIPPELEELVMQALAKQGADRPHAADFGKRLSQWLPAGSAVAAPGAPPPVRSAPVGDPPPTVVAPSAPSAPPPPPEGLWSRLMKLLGR